MAHRIGLAATAMVLLATPASAGERTALSALPTLPKAREVPEVPPATGVPGLTVKENQGYTSVEAATKQGYCVVSREFLFRFQGSASLDETAREVWRFVEADDKLTVEVVIYGSDKNTKSIWVKSRASVVPREIGSHGSFKVWGFRDANGDLVVLARGADSGVEAIVTTRKEDFEMFRPASSECTFGAVRMTGLAVKNGAAAQLSQREMSANGSTSSLTLVDVSASKLSRDPEPFLAVRVRHSDSM